MEFAVIQITLIIFLIGLSAFLFAMFSFYKRVQVFSKKDAVVILSGAVILFFISLFVHKITIGGTIERIVYGWPHTVLSHQTRDIVDNVPIDKWGLNSGPFAVYFIENFLFYLSIMTCITFLVKLLYALYARKN